MSERNTKAAARRLLRQLQLQQVATPLDQILSSPTRSARWTTNHANQNGGPTVLELPEEIIMGTPPGDDTGGGAEDLPGGGFNPDDPMGECEDPGIIEGDEGGPAEPGESPYDDDDEDNDEEGECEQDDDGSENDGDSPEGGGGNGSGPYDGSRPRGIPLT